MSYETNRLPLNCNDIPCLPSNHTTAGNSKERDEESLRLRNGFLASDMEFEQETSRFCDSGCI